MLWASGGWLIIGIALQILVSIEINYFNSLNIASTRGIPFYTVESGKKSKIEKIPSREALH
jgi:hypothetical protein